MAKMNIEDVMNILGENENVNSKQIRVATAAQLKFYNDLCEQKGTVPETILSAEDADRKIKELLRKNNFVPATEKQIDKIKELCDMMKMPYPKFEELDGSYNGTASQFIQKLNEKKRMIRIGISDKQIELIEKMLLCPDVPSVEKKDYKKWSMTEAHSFINDHKTTYYTGVRSRPTVKMIGYIKSLTKDNGDELGYEAIIQMDFEMASKFIAQLEAERTDKTLTTGFAESEVAVEEALDTNKKLKELVVLLYADIGQELEDEFFETMDWNGLKELVEFVQMYHIDPKDRLENSKIFTEDQIAFLLA